MRVWHQLLELVLAKQAELVVFDRAIQDTLTDADLEADLTTPFEYGQKVSLSKTSLATEPRPRISPDSVDSTASPTAQLASPPHPAGPSAAPEVSSAASFYRVDLPKLHIPIFSGERCGWQGFWDQYQASIQGNGSLSKTEEFKDLITYLSGSAETAIQGIRLAEANYDVDIQLLSFVFFYLSPFLRCFRE